MRNAENGHIVKCLVKSFDSFQADVRAAIHRSAFAAYSTADDKVEFFDEIGYRSEYESLALLSEYYGVTIHSVHCDGVDAVQFWLDYTE